MNSADGVIINSKQLAEVLGYSAKDVQRALVGSTSSIGPNLGSCAKSCDVGDPGFDHVPKSGSVFFNHIKVIGSLKRFIKYPLSVFGGVFASRKYFRHKGDD